MWCEIIVCISISGKSRACRDSVYWGGYPNRWDPLSEHYSSQTGLSQRIGGRQDSPEATKGNLGGANTAPATPFSRPSGAISQLSSPSDFSQPTDEQGSIRAIPRLGARAHICPISGGAGNVNCCESPECLRLDKDSKFRYNVRRFRETSLVNEQWLARSKRVVEWR